MKPCPFCAELNTEEIESDPIEGWSPVGPFECLNCGARGPTSPKMTAEENWNTRTQPISTTLPTEADGDGPYWWKEGDEGWHCVGIAGGYAYDVEMLRFEVRPMKRESWPKVGQWIKIERP